MGLGTAIKGHIERTLVTRLHFNQPSIPIELKGVRYFFFREVTIIYESI